ncbi:MAG: hypothetical protein M9953_13230 [Thermomicrobiales bacterium]|nr:hypothetical protein [Thermomicrobiales bacterium]MCO5228976.1 hypothetical protein [Thermomicrobiales bacterium]
MTTEHLTPHAAPQLLTPETRLGPVHLDVTNGANSTLFWTRYIGLRVIAEREDCIELGVDGKVLIALHPGVTGPVVPRRTGLYHVAIHVPAKVELARVVARLASLSWQQSPTDHTESMATYLSDPDGNGIEITFETPDRGHLVRDNASFGAMLADGTMRSATEALDVNDLLSTLSADDDLSAPMLAGTRIGHVHLHVGDLDATRKFYRDVIGFGDMRAFERFGMSDFSLITSYVPHALAINTWNGRSATPKPEDTAGLREWTLIVPQRSELDAVQQRLTEAGFASDHSDPGLITTDPSGNRLHITVEE